MAGDIALAEEAVAEAVDISRRTVDTADRLPEPGSECTE